MWKKIAVLLLLLLIFQRPILLALANYFWIGDILHGLHVTMTPILWITFQDQWIVGLDTSRSAGVAIGLVVGAFLYIFPFVVIVLNILLRFLP